jgi:hypothetical protein
MDWLEIVPGESYACEFTVETMLTVQGVPPTLDTDTLDCIGTYTSTGIILVRDVERELARVQDIKTQREFVVRWQDTAKIDTIEWQENNSS